MFLPRFLSLIFFSPALKSAANFKTFLFFKTIPFLSSISSLFMCCQQMLLFTTGCCYSPIYTCPPFPRSSPFAVLWPCYARLSCQFSSDRCLLAYGEVEVFIYNYVRVFTFFYDMPLTPISHSKKANKKLRVKSWGVVIVGTYSIKKRLTATCEGSIGSLPPLLPPLLPFVDVVCAFKCNLCCN